MDVAMPVKEIAAKWQILVVIQGIGNMADITSQALMFPTREAAEVAYNKLHELSHSNCIHRYHAVRLYD